jgi:hypothetical protein
MNPSMLIALAFAVPGHGSLLLNAPKEWQSSAQALQSPPSVAFRFRPASGEAFSIQVTSLWIDPVRQANVTPDSIKESVRSAAADSVSRAAEKEAPLVELRGKEAIGYYFSVTDRESSSGPGQYRYMTQGTFVTGPLMNVFTILHRDAAAPEKEQALRAFANATYTKVESNDASASEGGSIQVQDVDGGYRLSLPASRLVMTIPREGLKKAPNPSSASPSYFYFIDEQQGLSVSGWFEPAEGFRGTRRFWDAETKEWKRRGIPGPQQVSFTKVGDWDAVLYDVPVSGGTNSHVRAHWVQAGTWIDLHLSLTSTLPSAASRTSLLELLKTVRVKQRD